MRRLTALSCALGTLLAVCAPSYAAEGLSVSAQTPTLSQEVFNSANLAKPAGKSIPGMKAKPVQTFKLFNQQDLVFDQYGFFRGVKCKKVLVYPEEVCSLEAYAAKMGKRLRAYEAQRGTNNTVGIIAYFEQDPE